MILKSNLYLHHKPCNFQSCKQQLKMSCIFFRSYALKHKLRNNKLANKIVICTCVTKPNEEADRPKWSLKRPSRLKAFIQYNQACTSVGHKWNAILACFLFFDIFSLSKFIYHHAFNFLHLKLMNESYH